MNTPSPALAQTLGRLSRLLQQQPSRYGTHHLHEAQSHLRSQDRSIALKVREPALFRGYRELHLAPMPNVVLTLGCIESGSGYELSFRSGDEMLVNIPLRGQGWVSAGKQTLEMAAGQVLLVGPSCQVTKHWHGPGEVLSLHVPLRTLAGVLTHAQDEELALPPYLPPVTMIDHGRLHMLLGFVELLVHDHDAGRNPLADRTVAEHAERLLLSLLVEGLELGKPGSLLPADAAAARAKPYYVRRAEDFMRSHASAELSLDDLASAAGVSVRTLQYGFRNAHALSPMSYLKRVRLEQARAALRISGLQHRRVGEIAAETGFTNVSQFSRDYRAMFGESPSETVAAPRRLCDAALEVPSGAAIPA